MPISDVNKNVFADVVYDNATLYIPNGEKLFYDKREPWNLFFYIVEMDINCIDEVKGEHGKVKGIYDLSGRRITEVRAITFPSYTPFPLTEVTIIVK